MKRHQNQSYSVSDTGPSVTGAARVGGPFSAAECIKEEQEYEYFVELEERWRKSLPHLSEIEWLEIFPEARVILPDKIREWDTERKRLIGIAKRALHRSTSENAIETRLTLQVSILPRINEAEGHIKRLRHLIAYRPGNPVRGRITEADIERAREVPIASLISSKIRRTGKTSTTNCPLHNERSPSFVIYHETNSCWCFGCQQGGDSIALVQLLNNLSFIEAVKYLNRV